MIVNCGGRTRSIIGAQSLINAGVPNKVVSLKNGTQAWHLAGFPVLNGATARPPAMSRGRPCSGEGAGGSAWPQRFGIARIDAATLARWRAESALRTLYVFDVRTPEEYEAGHIPGMKNVPGGQLVQETDRHAATWGARVVLVDDDGVRAVMTAHWMKQMGWDVAAMTVDMRVEGSETGAWTPRVLGLDGVDGPDDRRRFAAGARAGRRRRCGRRGLEPRLSRGAYSRRVVRNPRAARRDSPRNCRRRTPWSSPRPTASSRGWLPPTGRDVSSTPVLALEGGTAAWRSGGIPVGARRDADGERARRHTPARAGADRRTSRTRCAPISSGRSTSPTRWQADDDQRFRIEK